MPPDEQDTSTDAPTVPSDDIQLVRPASRVRELLGLPDDAGDNLVFLPSVPPVGFRYTEDRFMGELDPLDSSLPVHDFQDVRVDVAPFPPSAEETASDTPDASGRSAGNAVAAETRWHAERSRHIALPPEPVALEHPAGVPSQTRLEMPGGDARPTTFPAFSDETAVEPTVDASAPREPAAPPPLATRSPSDVASVGPSKPPLAAESASGTSAHPAGALPQTRLEIPGVSARPTTFPVFPDETATGPTIERASSTITPADSRGEEVVSQAEPAAYAKAPMIPPVRTPERPPQRMETDSERLTSTSSQQPPAHTVTGDGPVVRSAGKTPRNPGFSLGLLQSIGMPTDRMADRHTADESIEQLQQTVYELTSKLASLQAQVNNQAQREQRHAESAHPERSAGRPEPTPPPPPQPVVIIKQSAHQDRPTQAFWARRYLGRLHRRPLR